MDPLGLGSAPSGPDDSTQAFVSGLFTGAGLRELSQQLGLSRRRQGLAKGETSPAQPPAAEMMAGNLGDLDKILLLARAQQAFSAGTPAAGPMLPPGMPGPPGPMPPGAPGLPPMGGPPPGMPPGLPPGMPPMGGLPPGLGPPPGMGPLPPMPPAPGPPGGMMPGGALQVQLLQQLLQSAGP